MPYPYPAKPLARRAFAAALVAMPALWTGARAQMPTPLRATPSQTEGPFYPLDLPADSDADLLHNGTLEYRQGQAVWLDGSVTNLLGQPVSGAQIEIWQCDAHGHYHHPGDGNRADKAFQGFGKVVAGADGRFRFRTMRPVAYTGRTPHIHVKVRLGQREMLTTQLYVAGDPGNEHDAIWRRMDPRDRAAVTVPFVKVADGLRANFPVIIAG